MGDLEVLRYKIRARTSTVSPGRWPRYARWLRRRHSVSKRNTIVNGWGSRHMSHLLESLLVLEMMSHHGRFRW